MGWDGPADALGSLMVGGTGGDHKINGELD